MKIELKLGRNSHLYLKRQMQCCSAHFINISLHGVTAAFLLNTSVTSTHTHTNTLILFHALFLITASIILLRCIVCRLRHMHTCRYRAMHVWNLQRLKEPHSALTRQSLRKLFISFLHLSVLVSDSRGN